VCSPPAEACLTMSSFVVQGKRRSAVSLHSQSGPPGLPRETGATSVRCQSAEVLRLLVPLPQARRAHKLLERGTWNGGPCLLPPLQTLLRVQSQALSNRLIRIILTSHNSGLGSRGIVGEIIGLKHVSPTKSAFCRQILTPLQGPLSGSHSLAKSDGNRPSTRQNALRSLAAPPCPCAVGSARSRGCTWLECSMARCRRPSPWASWAGGVLPRPWLYSQHHKRGEDVWLMATGYA
jgi:hypothetical protein